MVKFGGRRIVQMSEFDWEYYLLAAGSLALAVIGLLFLFYVAQ